MRVEDYLSKPYSRCLIPDPDSGTYTAKILEFPGCVAQADSIEEAYRKLEAAAESWITSALELGQSIPEPSLAAEDYSGKVLLRLPRSLHQQAARMAEADNTSLNQFIVYAIAEKVGAATTYSMLMKGFEKRLVSAVASTAFGSIVSIATTPAGPTLETTILRGPAQSSEGGIVFGDFDIEDSFRTQ